MFSEDHRIRFDTELQKLPPKATSSVVNWIVEELKKAKAEQAIFKELAAIVYIDQDGKMKYLQKDQKSYAGLTEGKNNIDWGKFKLHLKVQQVVAWTGCESEQARDLVEAQDPSIPWEHALDTIIKNMYDSAEKDRQKQDHAALDQEFEGEHKMQSIEQVGQDVGKVQAYTGCNKAKAIELLNLKTGDVEKAVDEYWKQQDFKLLQVRGMLPNHTDEQLRQVVDVCEGDVNKSKEVAQLLDMFPGPKQFDEVLAAAKAPNFDLSRTVYAMLGEDQNVASELNFDDDREFPYHSFEEQYSYDQNKQFGQGGLHLFGDSILGHQDSIDKGGFDNNFFDSSHQGHFESRFGRLNSSSSRLNSSSSDKVSDENKSIEFKSSDSGQLQFF